MRQLDVIWMEVKASQDETGVIKSDIMYGKRWQSFLIWIWHNLSTVVFDEACLNLLCESGVGVVRKTLISYDFCLKMFRSLLNVVIVNLVMW